MVAAQPGETPDPVQTSGQKPVQKHDTQHLKADTQTDRAMATALAAQGHEALWLSAFDNNRAVISTMGMTRSYAMRDGPMTPSVPTIFPSTP